MGLSPAKDHECCVAEHDSSMHPDGMATAQVGGAIRVCGLIQHFGQLSVTAQVNVMEAT